MMVRMSPGSFGPDDPAALALMRALPQPVLLVGPDASVVWANPAADALFAYPEGGLVGEAADDLLPVGWGDEGSHEGRIVSAACVEVAVLVQTRLVHHGGAPHRMVTLQDHDEVWALEAQLLATQRRESIGALAGGVTAELSNVLTVILGNTSLVRRELGAEHPLGADLDATVREAERAARVVRQLMSYTRQGKGHQRRISLGDLLTDMSVFFSHLFGRQIQVRVDLPPALPHVMVDPAVVEHVVSTASLGARDGMPTGGILTFAGRRVLLPPAAAVARGVRAGSHVEVVISHTGAGAEQPETAPRGRELALLAARAALREQGGTVELEQEPGRGTVVVLLLPAMEEVPEEEAPTVCDLPPFHGETLLLVEDEHPVRRLMAHVLRAAGYAVVPASDGIEARALFEAEPERFEGAVIDVRMPRMSALELQHVIAARRPDLPVLWVSGGPSPEFVQGERVDFLAKPFTPAELGDRLRALLDRTALLPS